MHYVLLLSRGGLPPAMLGSCRQYSKAGQDCMDFNCGMSGDCSSKAALATGNRQGRRVYQPERISDALVINY